MASKKTSTTTRPRDGAIVRLGVRGGANDAARHRSSSGTKARMKKLGRSFYARSASDVAQDLIGKILVCRLNDEELRVRIIETEAYLGPQDLASHASKGRTRRTEVMFGPAGHAYVYLIYGMHEMLNVVTGITGEAHAVLIRGAVPVDDRDVNLSGPGRLTRALRITPRKTGSTLPAMPCFS